MVRAAPAAPAAPAVTTPTEDVNALFSSLQNTIPAGIMRMSARRLRQNIRRYSPSIISYSPLETPATTPDSSDDASSTSSKGSRGFREPMLPPMYSNWVFVTSAEVLSRAGEEDSEEDDQEKEGESTKGGWTKRQYREEGEKLRGKEWVFR